jgi:Capsule assembly protein Wzi
MHSRWFFFSLVSIIFMLAASAGASTYLDLSDASYELLSRLEAAGIVRSGLLTTRPLSREEAVRLLREAETNSEGSSDFIKGLVQELKQRIGPEQPSSNHLKLLDTAYARYSNTNADVRTLTYGLAREQEQSLNANNDGDVFSRGGNARVGFTSRLEDAAGFSVFLNPEFRSGQSTGNELVLRQGYVVYDLGWDIVAGRDSLWWGPGHHGAILLTNNAEPFTMVRIANPDPVILPWVFKYLGPFDFTWFATQLERDRADVAAPYLWGMRLNFKPHPILEIGLERTALLGGRGRPTTAKTWLNQLIGRNDHFVNNSAQDTGDQRAGYDLKLTLPFAMQPVQAYMEADGEDSYHGFLPRYWAYLYGLYLPQVLSIERLEFRLEWARTFDRRADKPTSWYLNGIYTSGYTYNGRIIGHHMGTDSQDLFMELTCRVPEKNARVSLAYDRMGHNLSFDVNEIEHELSVRTVLNVSDATDLDLTYGYSWTDNAENVQGVEQRAHTAAGMVTRRF